MAKVLLVEDDNNLREIYQARLTAEGYDIIAAQNGEDALVLAKQHHPDLVISDIMMPRISGYEMLDILRNTDELKHTKVIMLTALGQNEDKERAGKLGADKYLVKSQVTLEDIVNSAKALLADDSVASSQSLTADPTDPLGMTSTSQTNDAGFAATSAVAPTVTPLSPSLEEPVGTTAATPTTTEPDVASAAQPAMTEDAEVASPTLTVVAPIDSVATTPEVSPSAAIDTPASPAPNVQPIAQAPANTPTPAVESSTPEVPVVPPSQPMSVDELINNEAAVEEIAATSVETESNAAGQANVTPQFETFSYPQTETATTEENVADQSSDLEPPEATAPIQVEETQQANDNTLNDALTALTSESATSSTPPATAPAEAEPEVEPQEADHQIEGLSGVTEVVEVPTEAHVDPTPSPNATVIQPQVETFAEPEATATPTVPPSAPMSQTIVPTELAPTPVETTPEAPENDGVNVVGKKVIQPLNDPNAKPDLDKLLADEEAKQAGSTIPAPTVNGQAAAPTPKPQNGFDPSNIAL